MSAANKALFDAKLVSQIVTPDIIGRLHLLYVAGDLMGPRTAVHSLEEAALAAASLKNAIDLALAEARLELAQRKEAP